MYDEPFADASQIPTFIVSRLARSEVTVALSGDGGDELFAGYNSYPRCLRQWEKSRRMPKGMRPGLAAPGLRTLNVGKEGGADAGDLAGRDPGGEACPLGSSGRSRLGAGPLATVLTDPGRWARVDDPLQAMQLADIEGYLTDDILVKVDRASMAVALEVRCPLLDWRVVEYALGLPSSMRMGTGGGKLVLRNLLARHVPRELTERPKRGFAIPVTLWMRGPLRDWVESLLDESRLRQEGFFNADRVQRIWRQHLAGSHNHEQLLWSILMFQAWNEHWQAAAGGVPMRAAS